MFKIKLIIMILLLIFALRMSMSLKQKSRFNSKIAVFAGSGALFAEDLKVALEKLNIKIREINENDIKTEELQNFEILIIPGGRTQEILEGLKEKGFEKIKEFVKKGGKYIGICAGAK